ncbi:MAG: hypothetical protein WD035_12135 [Balneolaceae bacterium]
MHTGRICFTTLLLLWIAAVPVRGQTCSCAGAPLISSQSSGASSAGNFLLGLTYEHHEISNLYNEDRSLDDENDTRNTRSLLLEIHYGITNRLSISGTFSHVGKDRTTGRQFSGGGQTVSTSGIGDGVFLLRYIIHPQSIWEQYHLAVGAGAKVPFGTTSLTRQGLALNMDMQPGTGAWDGVGWSYASVSFLPHTTMNLFWSNSFRYTGSAERFQINDRYSFGNEWVSDLGVNNTLTGNLSWILQLRYRSSSSDRINDGIQPNTGGKWLYLQPRINYAFTDLVSMQVGGRIPLYQNVNGTQPTSTYAISGTLFLNFNSNESVFIYANKN